MQRLPVTMTTPAILVVEDDRTILELICEVLDEQGYTVQRWAGGEDVVALVHRIRPDLIILDIWLGSAETGWSILERLQSEPGLASLPVIICSADVRMLRQRVRQEPAARWHALEKPFALGTLIGTVENALAHR
jgi:CheY-like chemotaxis protein